MKKKVIIIVVAALAVIAFLLAYFLGLFPIGQSNSDVDSSEEIYCMSVSDIMGLSTSLSGNVYMGLVEGQETTGVTLGSEYKLDQVFVSVGDTVSVGDPLFSYQTGSIESEIKDLMFDIESENLQIEDYNRQIANYQKQVDTLTDEIAKSKVEKEQKEKAKEKEDLEYQISSVKTSIAISENTIAKTKEEISDKQEKMNNSVVNSPANGTISKIADENNVNEDGYFITILAEGDKRVKGKINEQNVASINVGERVTLRSRVDESATWSGTIEKIDTETTSTDENVSMYVDTSSSTTGTNYPFYITLDDATGLMMGQHLYIEVGEDTSSVDLSDGVHLYDYYLDADENGDYFVWIDRNGKLAKQYVTLGDYDEESMTYEITDGLEKSDEIAYPMEDYTEGMSCVTAYEGE